MLEIEQENFPAALQKRDRASVICQRETPAYLMCLVIRANRVGLLARMGRGAEAMQVLDDITLTLTRRKMLEVSEYAQVLEAKALAFQALGRSAEAMRTQQAAIALYQKTFADTHIQVQRA